MLSSPLPNQNPEQIARDRIDKMLADAGWIVQDHTAPDMSAGLGIALKEYPTDTGPVDYLLVVDKKPCGLIEAKKFALGYNLAEVEKQSEDYADAPLKIYGAKYFIRFVYESTGIVTRFRDRRDPKPRSREVFSFLRPETMRKLLDAPKTLRGRLAEDIPPLAKGNLRDCQHTAISNLEQSFAAARPRALVQMATGAGKTFTAITSVYRLLKHANARRVLMLVDTRQLGIQAQEEFQNYQPVGEQFKFPELYPVQRLTSSSIDPNVRVCISTIQRMYSILKGQELDESSEEDAAKWQSGKEAVVDYNPSLPPEFFDFVIVDECHRSIYNLWRQVLEYYDAFLIGLTATPDHRTFGYFNQNVVSEYTHEQAVLDGVNVGGDVYLIETQITQNGATISCEQQVRTRDKLTRAEKWQQLDDDLPYTGRDLDKKVVNKSQIRTVITAFKDALFTRLFPPQRSGKHIPKTLIFAKDDSHANDIVDIVREVFGEGNAFCKKVTYQSTEDPKSVLTQFRNDYYPRIAVTVDMIATGTDVKPLECLLFMRDVRSANYFEQMKGRGTRTIDVEALKKVTPDALDGKQRYILVDAVGVTSSMKTISGSFEKKPGVSLKELLQKAALAQLTADEGTSLAGRLVRLNAVLTDTEKAKVSELTGGSSLQQIASSLYQAFDPDNINAATAQVKAANPALSDEQARVKAEEKLQNEAVKPFNGKLNDFIVSARKAHDQYLADNLDTVTKSEWAKDSAEKCAALIQNFEDYLKSHQSDILPLQIFFTQPYRRQEVTLDMITDFLDVMRTDKPDLSVENVWHAYHRLGQVNSAAFDGSREIALLSLIRHVAGIDKKLTPFAAVVDANYKAWVFKWNNAHPGNKLTDADADFMRHVRDTYKTSLRLEKDYFAYPPLLNFGGYHRLKQIFGNDAEAVINELNEALAA